MLAYTIRRLLLLIPTLLGISLVTFCIVSLAPGDPATLQIGMDQDPEKSARVYEELRRHFGLDQPVLLRYGSWLWKMVTFDFGTSFTDGRPVLDKIGARLPATMSLAIVSIVLGLVIAVPVGILSAAWRDGWFDRVTATILYALFAIPGYVAAIVLIFTFGVWLEWLPFQGMTGDDYERFSFLGKTRDLLAHFTLITICYMYHGLASDARFVRQNLLEVLQQDFVRTAHAKGVAGWRVVLRHALPNTMIPLVTRAGLLFPAIVSGSVILERIFNWPGIGRLFLDSVLQRDHPTVMALSVITALLVLLGTLIADLLYAVVDPRISYA